MPWPCPFEFQLQKNFSNSIWTPSLLVDNTAVQWFLCLFLYLVTQHQRILPGFTSIHLRRERVVCITPQCSTITPIQLMCVLSGPFGLRDGLGSTCVLLQERTCLRTFAHIKHKWRRHMDKMGFSSVQLEGPSASCLPWLPTALHSATSKDGLQQNSLGSKPCGSYRQQLRAKERLNHTAFENTVRERTSRLLFSVTSW